MQTDGVVSFPIPLQTNEKIKLNYRNEVQSETPESPCLGTPTEPIAEAGNLCVYRGGAGLGSKESGPGTVDQNAHFAMFEDSFGDAYANGSETSGGANSGDEGILIVFRTNEYTPETPKTIKTEAHLTAQGSWAVTAK